jgi:hypothetical protein
MKALYSSQLPVYNVEMDGWFPIRGPRGVASRKVLVAYLEFNAAERIPWKRWDRAREGDLWSLLTYKFVDPRFA